MPPSLDRLIAELDGKILELGLLLQYQLDKEAREGKYTLLISRGMRYNLEKLEKRRSALREKLRSAPNKQMTYKTELAKREQELVAARKELADSQDILGSKIAYKSTLTGMVSIEMVLADISDRELLSDIRSQKTRVRNKERALANWIAKEKDVTSNVSRPRSQAAYREEKKLMSVENEQFYSGTIEQPRIAPRVKTIEDTALGKTASFKETKLDDSRFNMIHQLKPQGLGGGWGDSTSNYEPPPQQTKITID